MNKARANRAVRAFPLIGWLLLSAGMPVWAGTYQVSVNGTAFSPATLPISVGDTVVWMNNHAGSSHTTSSDLPAANPNYWSGVMAASETFSQTFNRLGTFAYHDELGLGAGTISVGAAPTSCAKLQSPRKEGGQFLFEATGLAVGNTNVLQASANLVSWVTLSTNVAANSSMTFTNATAPPSSFFRLAGSPPPAPVNTQWQCQSPLPQEQELYGVSALDAGNVWAVGGSLHGGADGVIVHYDGAGWGVQAAVLPNALFGVCALNTSNVWAVGAAGTILHYDGTGWQPQVSGTPQWLYGVSALNASNVWAVGYGGTLLHYDGAGWSAQTSGTAWQLRAVSVLDANNIWAVGDQGTILHYDGTNWSPQASGSTEHLRGVSAHSATDVWAVWATTAPSSTTTAQAGAHRRRPIQRMI